MAQFPDEKRALVAEVLKSLTRGELLLTDEQSWEDRPSLVWRSDAFLLGVDIRWAKRVYVYERVGGMLRGLGFLNLRPLGELHESAPEICEYTDPIAEACLAIPTHWQEPKYHLPGASNYCEFYGERVASPVTPYCRPGILFGGTCIQACLVMSQIMLARRGFRVLGPHEMTFLARRSEGSPQARCRFNTAGGFRLPDAQKVLCDAAANGNALKEVYDLAPGREPPDETPTNSQDLKDPLAEPFDVTELTACNYILNQYLRLGLPVILALDYAQLWPDETERRELKKKKGKNYLGHAILLIGAKYGRDTQLAHSFLFHDPGSAPYLERDAMELLKIAANNTGNNWGKISFLVPMLRGIECGLFQLFLAAKHVRRDLTNCSWKKLPREVVEEQCRGRVGNEGCENEVYQLIPGDEVLAHYIHEERFREPIADRMKTEGCTWPSFVWAVERYTDEPLPGGESTMSAAELLEPAAGAPEDPTLSHEPAMVWLFDAGCEKPADADRYATVGMLDNVHLWWWGRGRSVVRIPVPPLKSRRTKIVL